MDTPRSLLVRLRTDANADAWIRFEALYAPWIRRVLNYAGVQPADQDDLQQEIFAVLAREVPRFDHNGRPGAFRCWLKTIVMHRLQHQRRTKHTAEQHLDRSQSLDALLAPVSDLDAFWDREHDRHVVAQLMQQVSESFSQTVWRAFERQVVDGWKASETARELGVSVNAALLAKSRVLRRLREEAAGLIDE